MKRKILSGFLALMLLFTLLPVLPAGAARSSTDIPYAVTGGNIYFDKETGTITDCDQTVTAANIPEKITGVAVTTIGDRAFDFCHSLSTVTIPDSVTRIDDYAFDGCENLTAVTIGDSVTVIGFLAFGTCHSLTAVTIPDSVTTIGNSAFYNCDSLTAVTIGGSVTTIGFSAFDCCRSLTAVIIPDSVTTIGDSAFSDCDSLTTVMVPESVATIGDRVFAFCDSLKSIEVSSKNPNYSSKDGVLFDKTKTILYQYPGGKEGAYVIPNSVTTISEDAFNSCRSLTAVTIPDSVTTIGGGAFNGCYSLTAVTISDSITTIPFAAFSFCTSLSAVTIPDSVTTIDNGAFADCDSLTAVYFRGDTPKLGYNVFSIYINDGEGDKEINNPNLTLYYIEGKSGWTSPTWNGYPTATWDGLTYPKPDEPKPDDPKPDDPKPDDPSAPTFNDVPANAWFAGAVDYAVENGLMNGMGNNEFQPNTSMTRAMLVTVLWRYADSPKQGENTFTDVPAGKYYTEAVAWAAANGIVNGVGDGKFNPDGNITREQLVTILYRYCQKLDIDTSKSDDLTGFPDAGNVGNSAKDAMRWAVAEKLIGGKSLDASGTVYLQPKGSATRAEVATILMRFIENILK